MTEKEFLEKLNELAEQDDIESHKKIIELIDEQLPSIEEKDLKKDKYKAIKNKSEIRLLEIELNSLEQTDYKNRIHLTGRLIKLYKKQVSLIKDNNEKMKTRYQLLELQKSQKELTKNYKNSNKDIKLPEKVALTVKDIANTIDIFLNKKDVITKLKKIFGDTLGGGLGSTLFILLISGGALLAAGISPITAEGFKYLLPSLNKVLPVFGYIGLSNIVRSCLTKTQFEEYQYYQSEEFKEYVKNFKEENKELLEELNHLLGEKPSASSTEEKIQMNDALVAKLDEISSVIKDESFRRTFELQALGFIRENKDLCEKFINDYLDEKNNDTEKYKLYNEKLAKLNLEIFKRGNSLKDALVHAGKDAALSLVVLTLTKAIITLIAPGTGYAITSWKSFIIPIALAITNGLISIPTFAGKLKKYETKEEKEIEPKDEDKFRKLFGQYKLQPAV